MYHWRNSIIQRPSGQLSGLVTCDENKNYKAQSDSHSHSMAPWHQPAPSGQPSNPDCLEWVFTIGLCPIYECVYRHRVSNCCTGSGAALLEAERVI